MIHLDPRRHTPRILVDGLCGVVSNDNLRPATLRNLSESGLSIERPFDPATTRRVVQLEIDLPGIDEIVWAYARVTFAHLSPLPGRTASGQPRFWCRAGLRIDGICRSERRMLRDYVRETLQASTRATAGDLRPVASDCQEARVACDSLRRR